MPRLVCAKKEIPEGQSRKILLKDGGRAEEGLVIRYKGSFFAYRNKCAHIPLSLDWGDGEFFTSDGKFLACKNHGALYDPRTGDCVAGPCSGLSLEKIPLLVTKKELFIG